MHEKLYQYAKLAEAETRRLEHEGIQQHHRPWVDWVEMCGFEFTR